MRSPKRGGPSRVPRGFSMIELLVVLSIVMVLTGLLERGRSA
jgi:prepilin-type N-terminal cleavage/methylation domain-containing protein